MRSSKPPKNIAQSVGGHVGISCCPCTITVQLLKKIQTAYCDPPFAAGTSWRLDASDTASFNSMILNSIMKESATPRNRDPSPGLSTWRCSDNEREQARAVMTNVFTFAPRHLSTARRQSFVLNRRSRGRGMRTSRSEISLVCAAAYDCANSRFSSVAWTARWSALWSVTCGIQG